MFNKLIASKPQGRRTASPGAMTVSVVVHIILLAGAVYASVRAPIEAEAVEEEVTFLEIEENQPEPPAPPPEAPPPPVSALPPPPQGFQELIPPLEPPPLIPEISEAQQAVNLADFSGVGVAGGTAAGVEGGTPQNAAVDSTRAYEIAVLESPPRLENQSQVQSLMARIYPRQMLQAGISGTVNVQFVIEADGTVVYRQSFV